MGEKYVYIYSPTKSRLLQLLAPVQTITKLQQTNVVLSDLVDQVLASSELTQSELVMIFIVKHIHERCEEWVNILQRATLVSLKSLIID